jgi:hypothetical protein
MGVHKEIRKMFGSSVLNYMIAARTAQGYEDAQSSTLEERQDILLRWKAHKSEYQNSKMKLQEEGGPEGQERGRLTPKGFLQTRHLSFEERKKLHDERKARREEERQRAIAAGEHHNCPFCRRSAPHNHTPRPIQTTPIVLDQSNADQDEQFEHAIHASVAATSRGDLEEDLMIERAIRASVRELQKAQGSKLTDQEALERAIQASVAEGRRRRSDESSSANEDDRDPEHQALLEKAVQQSLAEYQLPHEDGDHDTNEDENLKLAIEKSKEETVGPADEDENLKLAIQMSKEDSTHADEDKMFQLALENSKAEEEANLQKTKTEEEIVLEYVKKQSLAEEAHRTAIAGKQKEEPHSEADEEALKKAIEESLKSTGGGQASGSGA